MAGLNTHDGHLTNAAVATALGLEAITPEAAIRA
jgi:alanine dehydrogenase